MALNGFNIAHKTNIYHHSLRCPMNPNCEVELKLAVLLIAKYHLNMQNLGKFWFPEMVGAF